MRPLGVKKASHNIFGSKSVNRGIKIGAKALGYVGDMAPVAGIMGSPIAPVLEAAKIASVGLGMSRHAITGRK